MVDPLFVAGVLIACFVAYNIGGSTTGPAFGPAIGANVLSKTWAGLLMAVAFFGGAYTIGRRVVDTLGTELVQDPGIFTLETSIIVLGFIGGALLVGNLAGTPASTSMTAVGAIAGLGLATGELNPVVIGEIFVWWVLSPIIGFWTAVMIGRYWYTQIDEIIAIRQSEGPLITIEQVGSSALARRPTLGPNTTRRELVGTSLLVAIGCLMAFSSGTSNIANAIAPLVGSGALSMNPAIFLGCGAVAVGALTIARRTMETLGNDITDLPLTAAIIVAILSSTIVIILSSLGVPASFVVVATVCIIGLGWGRSTHAISIGEAVRGEVSPEVSLEALAEGDPAGREPEREMSAHSASRRYAGTDETARSSPTALFDPGTTVRVILMQNVVPIIATVGSYLTFVVIDAL